MSQKIKLNRYLKFSFSFLIFLIITSFSLTNSSVAHATSCSQLGISFSGMSGPFTQYIDHGWQDITITGLSQNLQYKVSCNGPSGVSELDATSDSMGVFQKSGVGSFGMRCWDEAGTHTMNLQFPDGSRCVLGSYEVIRYVDTIECANVSVTFTKLNGQTRPANSICFEADDIITWSARLISSTNNEPIANTDFILVADRHYGDHVSRGFVNFWQRTNDEGIFTFDETNFSSNTFIPLMYMDFTITHPDRSHSRIPSCTKTYLMARTDQCDNLQINVTDYDITNQEYKLCSQVPGKIADGVGEAGSPYAACVSCLGTQGKGIWTSIGCISTDGVGTIRHLVVVALGMAGGIGLLMIIAAGAMFTMSRNDPKKVGDAKDMITSVLIGLLFIVFSVTILQFIGVGILGIPGFGS
jgi:hypothetical protein